MISQRTLAAPSPLKKLQRQYQRLLQTDFNYSIAGLIDEGGALQRYCRSYNPHPDSEAIIKASRRFCKQYGIWLENARHYITCQLFLYPNASFDRMLVMTNNNAIDYFLNDTMGRDLFNRLTPDEQQVATQMISRMSSLDESLALTPEAHPAEQANAIMLSGIRDSSPRSWFNRFLEMYNYHLQVTHRKSNTGALGYVPTVSEYVDMRYHTSGMPHIVLLMEYAENNFLDWTWLEAVAIASVLKRIHWLIAAFGSLSNDLFSFEKEVIDNSAEANLLATIALNEPGWHLKEVISFGAAMVRDILAEYFELMKVITIQVENLAVLYPSQTDGIKVHLQTIERCVQASWMWQVYTKRYKRTHSIWKETRLTSDSPVAMAV